MWSRIPDEWRIPLAFAVLWAVPLLVAAARPSFWQRAHGHAEVAVALALLLALVGALLRRSRVAWWILVASYVGGVVTWVQHVVNQGLGIAWMFWRVLMLVNIALLVSAPMRRFVRFRGRLAPDPS